MSMKHNKNDRRSERTRRILGRAIVELMAEKKYSSITVQDLLERANIGRSTFYSHYMDKDDLVLSEFGRVIQQMEQHTVATENTGHSAQHLLPSLDLLKHIYENRHLYKALVWGSGGETNIRNMQAHLAKSVEQNLAHLSPTGQIPPVPLPVLADFVVTAFLGLVNWWFNSAVTYSAEQVEAMFRQMVMPGVQAVISTEAS